MATSIATFKYVLKHGYTTEEIMNKINKLDINYWPSLMELILYLRSYAASEDNLSKYFTEWFLEIMETVIIEK